MEFKHISVLLQECIDGLNIKENGIYVDGTLGGAGHSSKIIEKLSPKGILIGIDRDTEALKSASERLKVYGNVKYIHGNHDDIKNILEDLNVKEVDGILLDLGVSSYQLDEASRGFSYMQDAPLDMRMNTNDKITAKDVVNQCTKDELVKIFRDYGEEKWASRIADFIVKRRESGEIQTTFELVDIIKAAIPAKMRVNGHPSKRTCQAIRIECNRELEVLKESLDDLIDLLNPGGRLCIITFHSLEDRIVKSAFRNAENPCICPPEFPVCVCGRKSKGKVISRKPILPSAKELEENSRSKSAKLRVFEKR